jgi:hypothetical protein
MDTFAQKRRPGHQPGFVLLDRSTIHSPIIRSMATDNETHHKVYMSFFERIGWTVQFLEPDLKTPIGRIRTFSDADKVRELIDRTPTPMNLETRNMIEHAINKGRGGMYLQLTEDQYRKLKR